MGLDSPDSDVSAEDDTH